MTESQTALFQRLIKNERKLKSFHELKKSDSVRLYDCDIPDAPFIIEKHGPHFVVWERGNPGLDSEEKMTSLKESIKLALNKISSSGKIVYKSRQIHSKTTQYNPELETKPFLITTSENEMKFLLNLNTYIDVGLFLDHRHLRQRLRSMNVPRGTMLNLFCYTGSLSIAAGLAGFSTTNVDLSNTYLSWAQENFALNKLALNEHSFIPADVSSWLHSAISNPLRYDVICLDPPSLSVSKKANHFSVQRDHPLMISQCLRLLKPNGVLFFSNNLQSFKLDSEILESYDVVDVTKSSIPRDFRNQKIHKLFEIRTKTAIT